MTDAIVLALTNGGAGASLVALLYLLSKLIDKYRPASVRASEALDDLKGQIGYWRTEVERCQADITELRLELRKMSAERHHFYDAIIRCSVEHPSTSEWWQSELEAIRQKITQ